MIDLKHIRQTFKKLYGDDCSGLWYAPGRVNLIGEHTDYNEGFVLPFALDLKVVVAARKRNDDIIRITSLDLDDRLKTSFSNLHPLTTGWSSYITGVIWTLRKTGYQIEGVDIVLSSDIPIGAGLSSSAAIECAVISALQDLYDLNISPLQRAKLARYAENNYVGVPTGLLDQAASTLCKKDQALFLDCRSLATQLVPLPLAEQNLEILVLDTKTPHSLVTSEYADRRKSCELAAFELGVPALRDIANLDDALGRLNDPILIKRTKHVVTENNRVLQVLQIAQDQNLKSLGSLLTASHISMRDDFEITVDTVDLAVEVALDHGALGARMTGGGFGGCILALCHIGQGNIIGKEIAKAFAMNQFKTPNWFIAKLAEGAGKLL